MKAFFINNLKYRLPLIVYKFTLAFNLKLFGISILSSIDVYSEMLQ